MENLEKVNKLGLTVKTTELEHGKEGQVISLLNVVDTENKLKEMAEKNKAIVVSRENLKDAEAGKKELRDSRLLLQKVMKQNQDFIKDVRKKNDECFQELIDIIEPEEKRLKEQIDAEKEKIAEEKRLKKEEELRKKLEIEKKIHNYESTIDALSKTVKTIEGKKEYVKFLNDLQDEIDADVFDDLSFEAKKIKAIGDGYLKVIDRNIEEEEKAQEKREEADRIIKEQEEKKRLLEEEKRKEAESVEKIKQDILNIRIKTLESQGFQVIDGFIKIGNVGRSLEDIKQMNEIDWYNLQSTLKAELDIQEKRNQKKVLEVKQESIEIWKTLQHKEIQLGAEEPRKFKGDYPTIEEIDSYKESNRVLNEIQRQNKANKVKGEIDTFKNEILEFFNTVGSKIRDTEFECQESRAILDNLMDRFSSSVDEVLGGVINNNQN